MGVGSDFNKTSSPVFEFGQKVRVIHKSRARKVDILLRDRRHEMGPMTLLAKDIEKGVLTTAQIAGPAPFP